MVHRRDARLVAEITVRDVGDPETPTYRARDVGVGGLYLELEHVWPVGLTRRLEIKHDDTELTTEARVVRSDMHGAALHFTDVSDAFRAAIRKMLVDMVYDGAELTGPRRAKRVETTSPVLWTLGNAQVRSTLEDVSTTGATIITVRPPPVDTDLYVRLPILEVRAGNPRVDQVRGCKARVVRHTAHGFAVRFIDISDSFRDAVLVWQGEASTSNGD